MTARIGILDGARTAAIVAMVIYHVVFDLEMFGWVSRGTAMSPPWRLLAICTASSFLVISGISLALRQHRHGALSGFFRRWAQVAVGAALVSVGTYIALPDAFVFFGILHAIAACLLIGLVLVTLPAPLLVGMAAFVISLPLWAQSDVFNHPSLWWTGLQTARFSAVDYIPLAPWLGPFILGLAFGKVAVRSSAFARLSHVTIPYWAAVPGRYSLLIYLLHQPLLFAVFSVARLAL